ncbi:Uncharacterised protein [Capnocytophaga canimorsus]|nr:Uncharacterised protein [Capnocytophaga canimorsus]
MFHVKHFKEDFKIKKILILKQQYKNHFYTNRSIICSTWNIKNNKTKFNSTLFNI